MPSPTDSERRKARDAALRTQDEVIGEHLKEALRSGELAAILLQLEMQGLVQARPGKVYSIP